MPKLLHTSDVQLGAPFHFLGEKGTRHRAQIRLTFGRIVDLALGGDFDLLLIVGDLFNDSRPTQATADFVAGQLGRLRIPVCILPGNHDRYDDASVYRTAGFPANVRILTGQPSILVFPDLDVTVYGNAATSGQSRMSPMRGLAPTGATRWHVALAHGNLVRPDFANPPRPITPDELRQSGMDYVALGDWHAFADYSQGRVRACYSGSPEPVAMDQQGSGYVAAVELDDDGVRVRPERVGAVRAEALSVDLSGRSTADALVEIRARADPNLMLTVRLLGLAALGSSVDELALAEELAPDFYHVRCLNDSHPQMASISSGDFPEQLVVGKFVRIMEEQIAAAVGETERRRAEHALQLGVALLQGRSVL